MNSNKCVLRLTLTIDETRMRAGAWWNKNVADERKDEMQDEMKGQNISLTSCKFETEKETKYK